MQVNIVFFVIMFYYDTFKFLERIYVDCPEDVNYRISKKLKQGEIKWN
jgi:hypothetical protein